MEISQALFIDHRISCVRMGVVKKTRKLVVFIRVYALCSLYLCLTYIYIYIVPGRHAMVICFASRTLDYTCMSLLLSAFAAVYTPQWYDRSC